MYELIQYIVDEARHTERHLKSLSSRQFDGSAISDIIFATHGHTHSQRSVSLSRIAELRQTAHVAKERTIKLIPLSTSVLYVSFAVLYFHCIRASCVVTCRCLSFFSYSFYRNIFLGNNRNIELIQFGRSKVAVIHYFINACTSWNSEYHWQCHIKWTCERGQHCHPCQ